MGHFLKMQLLLNLLYVIRMAGKGLTILEIYKKGLSKNSNSILLHTNYANNLKPTDKNEASEIISSYNIINRVRELYPDEYIAYGRAYLTLNKPEEAVPILKRAHENYPDNAKIQYILADAFASSGDEEYAYIVLEKVLRKKHVRLPYHQKYGYACFRYWKIR